MTKIVTSNGVELHYDDTIKVGDIITTYFAGFHKVTKITPRDGNTPLICFVRVADENGISRKSKEQCCDISYCRHARSMVSDRIAQKQHEISSLTLFLASLP